MLSEAARQAVRLLLAHKLRAALTLFGLVWGTASVILLLAWGRGVHAMMEESFFKMGKNVLQAWPGRIGEEFTPAVDRRELWFTLDDVERVRELARLPERVGAEQRAYLPLVHGERALNVEVRGMDPEAVEIRGAPVALGRSIGPADVEHRRRVLVLGAKRREELLGAQGGVGSWVRVDGTPFRVVGVLERLGTQLGRDGDEIDDQAWIPLSTFHTLWPAAFTTDLVVNTIVMRMRDRRLIDETEREVRGILAGRLGVSASDEEAILLWSPLRTLETIPLDRMNAINFILAAATLLVGGIGVLNMMLESVHERRQEIGVRLAVGARRRDVVTQFFLETLALVAIGGLSGAAIGVGLCLAMGSLSVPDLVPVPVLRVDSIVIALGVMSAVGAGAGVVPAWRAARVDPALTLRQE
jgi:putative ABC transport system permease protein